MTVTYKVFTGSTGTSTGNRDITYGGWGETPKAAIIVVTEATAFGSETDGLTFAICLADGTTTASICSTSQHNVGTSNCWQNMDSDSFVKDQPDGAGTTDFDGTVSFIAGGIRINFSDAPSADFKVMVIAWAGDLTAVVNTATTLNTTPINVTHASGVSSEVVFAVELSTASSDVHSKVALGVWADGNSGNRCYNFQDQDNFASTRVRNHIRSALIVDGGQLGGTNRRKYACSQHADGFTLTQVGADTIAAGNLHTLSLNFSDSGDAVDTEVGAITTPTSTGTSAVSGIGFNPGLVIIGSTWIDTEDTLIDDDDAGSVGLGAFTADDEASMCNAAQDAAATTDTSSHASNSAAMHLLGDPSVDPRIIVAAFDSMDAGGFTLDFNPVDSTGRKWWYLAFEAPAAGNIAGTMACTTTFAGAVTGSGAIAGTSAWVATITGAVTGSGAVAGTIPITATMAGAITGAGAVAGTVAITSVFAGAVTDSGGNIAGTVAIVATLAGAITGIGAIAGTIAATATFAGAVVGAETLSIVSTGAWSSAIDFAVGDEWRVTLTGPAADNVKIRVSLRMKYL